MKITFKFMVIVLIMPSVTFGMGDLFAELRARAAEAEAKAKAKATSSPSSGSEIKPGFSDRANFLINKIVTYILSGVEDITWPLGNNSKGKIIRGVNEKGLDVDFLDRKDIADEIIKRLKASAYDFKSTSSGSPSGGAATRSVTGSSASDLSLMRKFLEDNYSKIKEHFGFFKLFKGDALPIDEAKFTEYLSKNSVNLPTVSGKSIDKKRMLGFINGSLEKEKRNLHKIIKQKEDEEIQKRKEQQDENLQIRKKLEEEMKGFFEKEKETREFSKKPKSPLAVARFLELARAVVKEEKLEVDDFRKAKVGSETWKKRERSFEDVSLLKYVARSLELANLVANKNKFIDEAADARRESNAARERVAVTDIAKHDLERGSTEEEFDDFNDDEDAVVHPASNAAPERAAAARSAAAEAAAAAAARSAAAEARSAAAVVPSSSAVPAPGVMARTETDPWDAAPAPAVKGKKAKMKYLEDGDGW